MHKKELCVKVVINKDQIDILKNIYIYLDTGSCSMADYFKRLTYLQTWMT